MLKFSADLNVSKVNEIKMKSCSQDIVLQTSIMSVSAENFILLQNLIIKQNAYVLNNISKQKLERHILKLTKADQMFFVKNALQKNQIQFLNTINNEVKVWQLTKSLILEKMKIMSYKNLKKVWVKYADKKTVKEVKDKSKCNWKHKSTALKTDMSELNMKII